MGKASHQTGRFGETRQIIIHICCHWRSNAATRSHIRSAMGISKGSGNALVRYENHRVVPVTGSLQYLFILANCEKPLW